ncbi:FAD-dependent oxidoreductase, partial [Bacteroidota bacterium]
QEDIFLNSTVWDILEGKRLAVKDLKTEEVYYVESDFLVVATGAVPFLPTFENDDLPGVYTAAVVQKMMNTEHTLLGKNVLTIGAGNIGYLTSYQLVQAGAKVKAIVEALPHEGGFPVQANRVRRIGIPVFLSHMIIRAVPNEDHTSITGAIVAECKDFKPIPGTEKLIDNIQAINICTGLVSDDALLIKGKEIFGRWCFGAGDAIRIGEGTSAVVRGKQAAMEILDEKSANYNYNDHLTTSKEYIDSQQEPTQIIDQPKLPSIDRMRARPFVVSDCLHGFACNPCEFACQHGALTKTSTSTIPVIDFAMCTGCMNCVYQCPGLAIFGYNFKKDWLFLPVEYRVREGSEVYLVNNNGQKQGTGVIEKVLKKRNRTDIVRIKSIDVHDENLTNIRGFILKDNYPEPFEFKPVNEDNDSKTYICHCDDVDLEQILEAIGNRKYISIDEIKHITHLGMGACRGKRCIRRLKQILFPMGITVTGDATPRGPLSNQVTLGEVYPSELKEKIITVNHKKSIKSVKVDSFVAGGGIGGSALFRYLAEAGKKPLMVNYKRGASWRNIAGGRPNFSIPELSDIANNNLEIFRNLQDAGNIDFRQINYVTFAHDEEMYKALEDSISWSDGEMIELKDFKNRVSPFINPELGTYKSALITRNCWQATPGKVVDLIRKMGENKGGTILEDCEIINVRKEEKVYIVLVKTHEKEYIEYHTPLFINALGPTGDVFAKQLGIETGIFPVKHQAFITRRLPMLGTDGIPLPMLIDRRKYKGFSAVYGQQLGDTGQIIGCASPLIEPMETDKNLKINSKEFIEIVSEVFVNWLPNLSSVGFQAVWAGYYVEPRMLIDPEHGLFIGLRGQGFMLGMHLAKLYVDKLTGKEVPEYFERLSLKGDGLTEKAFK